MISACKVIVTGIWLGMCVERYILIKETQRRQYEGYNTPLGCYTDQGPLGRGQYDGQGVYCGLSTASEVFLIFTTQQY